MALIQVLEVALAQALLANPEFRLQVPALQLVGAEPSAQELAFLVRLLGQAVFLEVVPASLMVRPAAARVLEEVLAAALLAKTELRVPVSALERVGVRPPVQEPAFLVRLQGQTVLLELVPASQVGRPAAAKAARTQAWEEAMAQALVHKPESRCPVPAVERLGAELPVQEHAFRVRLVVLMVLLEVDPSSPVV